ncbi:MAG: thioredoxin family protein [bacterium]
MSNLGKIIIFLLLIAIIVTIKIKQNEKIKPTTPIPVTVVKSQSATLPRFLELGSDACEPCKMMMPVLAEMRKEYAGKLQVDFIDVFQNKTITAKYGVQFIPTQIIFDANGVEIFRHTGFFPKEEIVKKLIKLKVL